MAQHTPRRYRMYECGICDHYHPWSFRGDCRDDRNRFGDPQEYAQRVHTSIYHVDVYSMEDRINA